MQVYDPQRWLIFDMLTIYFQMLTFIPEDPLPREIPSKSQPVTVHLRSPKTDLVVPSHQHPWAQIAYPYSGSIRVFASNTTWIVPSLRAVWIPPDVEHQVTMLGDVELRTIYVAPEAAPETLRRCMVFEVTDLLKALIEALRTNPSDGSAYADKRRKQLSQLILTELVQVSALSLGLPMPQDRRLQAMCKALTLDPGSTATLEEWAEVVGASSRTLARLFEQELGLGFGEWRQQLRLAAAIDLMGKRVPLNEVANKLGYANPAAFTVMFKRAFGVPPSQFIKN